MNAHAQSTSSASTHPIANATPAPAPTFKVLKQVSTNLLKLRPGMTIFVKITGKMEVAKELKRKPSGDSAKEPPTLIPCIDLTSGEVVSVIAGSVLKDLLNDEYSKDSYVGRGFQIKVLEQKDAKAGGGRRYNNYDVKEIEVPKS